MNDRPISYNAVSERAAFLAGAAFLSRVFSENAKPAAFAVRGRVMMGRGWPVAWIAGSSPAICPEKFMVASFLSDGSDGRIRHKEM
jgi:hypothetical protein